MTTVDGEFVRRQLEAAGLLSCCISCELESKSVRGVAHLTIFDALRAHASIQEGWFHGLHPDVGEHRTDFRGHRNAFGHGSLQIVIDRVTGKYYADVDAFSPYEDVVNFVGHSSEVVGHFFGKLFRRRKNASG